MVRVRLPATHAADAGDLELRDLGARDRGEILRDRFRVITDPPFVSYDSLPRGVRKSGAPNS
jgi:hypothetical protein